MKDCQQDEKKKEKNHLTWRFISHQSLWFIYHADKAEMCIGRDSSLEPFVLPAPSLYVNSRVRGALEGYPFHYTSLDNAYSPPGCVTSPGGHHAKISKSNKEKNVPFPWAAALRVCCAGTTCLINLSASVVEFSRHLQNLPRPRPQPRSIMDRMAFILSQWHLFYVSGDLGEACCLSLSLSTGTFLSIVLMCRFLNFTIRGSVHIEETVA